MWRSIISVAVVLIPVVYFGAIGRPAEMGLAIVGGAVAAAFLNIDKIQRFKGAGFEAEMQRAVDEVYATIETLKALARPLILSTSDILTMAGRIGGMDAHQKHKLMSDLEQIAEMLSLNEQEFKEARSKFHRYHTWDHYQRFLDQVIQDKRPSQEIQDGLVALRNYQSSEFPSETEIREQLGDLWETLGPDNTELLRDYIHYKENRSLRREQALGRE